MRPVPCPGARGGSGQPRRAGRRPQLRGSEPGQGGGSGRGRSHPPAHAPALGGRHEFHDDGRRYARHPGRSGRGLRPAQGGDRQMRTRAAAPATAFVVLVAGALGLFAQEGGPVVTTLTLFAGTASGLWRSTNWGAKWERVTGRSEGVSLAESGAVHGILPIGRQVYLAAEAGLFFSEDFGQTWKKLGLDVPVYHVLPSRYTNADP